MFDVVLNYKFLNFKFYLKKNNVFLYLFKKNVFIKLYEFFTNI